MSSEIQDLVDRWAAAEAANDRDALDAVLADGFVGVGAAGFVLGRDQWLGRFAGGLHNHAFRVEHRQVAEHGNTAIVVGIDAQQTEYGGHDASGRFRVTATAIRTNGTWQLASAHIGVLSPQADPGEE